MPGGSRLKAGERRESIFENEDAPDIDVLDQGIGFEALNVPDEATKDRYIREMKNISDVKDMHRSIEYSIGDRSQSSEYIQGKLRAAGFDVKAQAKLLAFFYERGHF